ncbi:MAG: hypothetical protein ACRD20_09775 [Terriglobales bacterium]
MKIRSLLYGGGAGSGPRRYAEDFSPEEPALSLARRSSGQEHSGSAPRQMLRKLSMTPSGESANCKLTPDPSGGPQTWLRVDRAQETYATAAAAIDGGWLTMRPMP